MFDYKKFKKEMKDRGHEVRKIRSSIIIIPNNNYEGYAKGFHFGIDIVKGYEEFLKLVCMDHYNTWIYSIKFKIKDKYILKNG